MAPWQHCFELLLSNWWPPGNTALSCLFLIYGPLAILLCVIYSISNLWPPGNTALRCLFVIYGPPGNTVLSLFLAATNNDTSWHYIQLRRSINPPKFPGITCNIILQYGAGRFSNKMNFFFFKSWSLALTFHLFKR